MKVIEEFINLMNAINEMKGKDGEMREKGLNDDEIKQFNNFEFNLDDYPASVCKWTDLPNVRKYFDFFMDRREEFL